MFFLRRDVEGATTPVFTFFGELFFFDVTVFAAAVFFGASSFAVIRVTFFDVATFFLPNKIVCFCRLSS